MATDPRLPPQLQRRATIGTGAIAGAGPGATRGIAVTNQARLAIARNDRRSSFEIQNLDVANPIEYGYQPGLVFGQGIRIPQSTLYSSSYPAPKGDIYLIAGVAGPLDVRISEASE